jgi:hypothetical protein
MGRVILIKAGHSSPESGRNSVLPFPEAVLEPTLYHLGLIRFLRDAGLLSKVTHITFVSSGSIMAAHLVLHWRRYAGTEADFDEAAAELLSFIQLDIRNQILRRFPLAIPVAWARRLLGKSNRKLTRAVLLEYHDEKHLYGDVSLFELPQTPRLHLLTTNLREGCLGTFHRDGLPIARGGSGEVVLEEALRNPESFESAVATNAGTLPASAGDHRPDCVDQLLSRLRSVLCHNQLQHEPLFAALKLPDATASEFLEASLAGLHHIEAGDQFWLNRHLPDTAFREATGKGCFSRLNSGLDCVIVSDVGRQIKVVKSHGGGLIRSALCSSDILMNRVWQPENENYKKDQPETADEKVFYAQSPRVTNRSGQSGFGILFLDAAHHPSRCMSSIR